MTPMQFLELPHYGWLAVYAPALLRHLFFFVHDGVWGVRSINRLGGRLELYFGWLRDVFIIPFALYLLGLRIYFFFAFGDSFLWPWEIPALGFAVYSRWWRWHGLAPLHEFARLNPVAHPSEFFDHLYRRLGFLPHRVPIKAASVINPGHVDFRRGKEIQKSFWILLCGVYDTFIFATLAFKTFRWKLRNAKEASSGLSIIWASRLAQVARMEVFVEKSAAVDEVRGGKEIYAINHKSFFDFCLAPYAYMRLEKDGSAASFIPRIMVAKDHFKDNFFLYKIVGFGQMLEAWGMIFVDRKSKESNKGRRQVAEAVKKILSGDLPFSIYPQGTRAHGQLWRDGMRWDAGYFCVGKAKRLKQEMGYLKKGVAYIAVETAFALAKHNAVAPVYIVPVGMEGIGTACPTGALKVQTETKVFIRVGDPIVVEPKIFKDLKGLSYQEVPENSLYKAKVEDVLHNVDAALQGLLDVATRLERRFFVDLREILDARGVDEVAVALKEWRKEKSHIVYVILDYTYALPPKFWHGFLTELANLLRHECNRDELVLLRTKIAECF